MPNDKESGGAKAAFQKNKKIVAKYSDPKTLVDHLSNHTTPLTRAAPTISQSLQTSAMQGQQFLQSKIPQSPNSMPLSGEHKANSSQMSKFNSYFDTVNDPISVLKHVKSGTLKGEHLEALQAVYPSLLQEMRTKVLEHMDIDKAKSLSYTTKLALSKFMGQPMDANMLPQAIMSNQAALTGPRMGANSSAPQPNRSTLGGLKELNLSNRDATETQEDSTEDDTNIK